MKEQIQISCLNLASGKRESIPYESLFFRPAVYGIIIKNKKVLLIPARHGHILPGGAVELGEKFEDALIREVYEESGLSVEIDFLLNADQDYYITADNQQAYHSINLVYSNLWVQYPGLQAEN